MRKKVFPYLGGFLFGAAGGAVIGLLNAPQSGEKTRVQIRNGIMETRVQVVETVASAQASAEKRVDEIRKKTSDLIPGVSEKASDQLQAQ